jgi:hypothetical protein
MIIMASAMAALLCACGGSSPEEYPEAREIAWNNKGEDAVRSKLKDPQSAEFTEVRFSDKGGKPMTCGYVNSKNGFGGYTGRQRFVAAGDQLAFLEEEGSDFQQIWSRYC